METGYAKLTVRFEDPFWVLLYERFGGGTCEACKLPFGAEPGDQEVYAFLLEHWRQLKFSPPVAMEPPPERKARRAVQPSAPGTRAQQALALQREEGKAARARRTRQEREAEEARKFALRQEKRREKRKGH